jgi:hypothetical protein
LATQCVLSIKISIWLYAAGTRTRYGECESTSTTAWREWQRAGSDASRADDDDIRIKRFIMVASAGMHARDLLLRTLESSILSHVAPTRCTHRRRCIVVPVAARDERRRGYCWKRRGCPA